MLLAVAGRAGTGSVDGGGLRSDCGHSDIAWRRLSTSLSETECFFCLVSEEQQARTGHQRGMGGRRTDDDGTHERNTDTNKLRGESSFTVVAAGGRSAERMARRRMPLLSRLRLFEDADAWRRIGFNVSEAGVAHVGGVDIELAGADCRDPAGWEFRSREGSGSRLKVDGISTRMSRFDAMSQTWTWEAGEAEHSNAAVGLYSVLVTAGDLQRTVQAMSESIFGPPARLLEKSPFSPKLSMAFFEAHAHTHTHTHAHTHTHTQPIPPFHAGWLAGRHRRRGGARPSHTGPSRHAPRFPAHRGGPGCAGAARGPGGDRAVPRARRRAARRGRTRLPATRRAGAGPCPRAPQARARGVALDDGVHDAARPGGARGKGQGWHLWEGPRRPSQHWEYAVSAVRCSHFVMFLCGA